MDRRSSITPWDLESMLCDETAEPKALPLSLLEVITNGFSDKQRIGSGAFAVVYKGMLENRTVAVKRISNTYMYETEFHREVECLMMVKHKNIVRFLGYCADTQGSMERYDGKLVMADVQQRLLCFEYLPKGCLHEYITDPSRGLRWRDRYQIITGICEGLQHLHEKNIVHFDLKPANILLDDNWVPKITDFGISRCIGEMQSQVISKIVGTPGYLAPESFNYTGVTYRHSYRLDMYSLGVIIIEMLTGKKGYHDVDKVVESWSNMLEKSQSDVQLKQVRVCAEIGIECIDSNPAKRPDTQHIINILNKYAVTDVIISQQINLDMLTGSMHALWLSYQQLNPDIRRCIEYCSIFPKGSKLRKNKLVPMWIAQGFVKTSCATGDIEDVAESYIRDLVSYSFLEPEEIWDGTDCFSVHYVLHDYLDKVAGNCFRIENESSHRGERWDKDVPRDIQHLFIHNYDGELITEKIVGLKKLLTLIVYVVEEGTPVEEEVIRCICQRLPKLRVLAFAFSQEHDPIKQPNMFSFPESISQLKNLSYLAFRSYSCEVILPSALTKLRHIQLLDFGIGYIVEFNFGELINLRHIFCSMYMEFPNISTLTSLQTFRWFTVRNEQGYEVKQLRNLNKLRGSLDIRGLQSVKSKEEALEANLSAKERLTHLQLRWHSDDTRCNPEVDADVLEGLCPPAGLERLQIFHYIGSRFPDWMVGTHNSGPRDLQEILFWGCGQRGPAPEFIEAFPYLRVLDLYSCCWDALPVNMEHLTSLEKLQIRRCLNIQSLPTLPQCLEVFNLYSCDDEFMMSCRTIGDPNWQKIQHIPIKRFSDLASSHEDTYDSDGST